MSLAKRTGVILLLLTAAACTRTEDYLEAFREQRAAWREMADILESIKDDATMAKAKTDLDERWPKFEAAARKASALPKPPPREVEDRLREHQPAMHDLVVRVAKQLAEVEKLPGGKDFAKHFRSKSESLSTAVQK